MCRRLRVRHRCGCGNPLSLLPLFNSLEVPPRTDRKRWCSHFKAFPLSPFSQRAPPSEVLVTDGFTVTHLSARPHVHFFHRCPSLQSAARAVWPPAVGSLPHAFADGLAAIPSSFLLTWTSCSCGALPNTGNHPPQLWLYCFAFIGFSCPSFFGIMPNLLPFSGGFFPAASPHNLHLPPPLLLRVCLEVPAFPAPLSYVPSMALAFPGGTIASRRLQRRISDVSTREISFGSFFFELLFTSFSPFLKLHNADRFHALPAPKGRSHYFFSPAVIAAPINWQNRPDFLTRRRNPDDSLLNLLPPAAWRLTSNSVFSLFLFLPFFPYRPSLRWFPGFMALPIVGFPPLTQPFFARRRLYSGVSYHHGSRPSCGSCLDLFLYSPPLG